MAALALTAALAACGSSSSKSSPTTTGSSPTSASSGSPTTASSALAADQAIVSSAEQLPTTIPLTTKLPSPPPAGKTFVFLQCEIDQCADIASGVKAAVAAAGWNLKVLNFQSANPATLITGLNEALAYHPVAVAFSGLPEVLWQSEIPAYQKAGAILIPAFMGPLTTPSPVVPYDIGAAVGAQAAAKQIAAWIAEDSGGTGHVLLLGVPSFPILAVYTTAFKADLPTECPGCSVTEVDATIPQVDAGQINSLIVSAVQKDPSIKYVSVVDGAFVDGLPAALASAGLTGKVKVTGIGADVTNETDILSGTDEYAFTALATVYSGWLVVDAAIRHVEGLPATDPEDGGLPSQLLTKSSMTSTGVTPANSYNYPTNYADQIKAIWGVS